MIKIFLVMLVTLLSVAFIAPQKSFAFDIFNGADCSQAGSSTVCQDGKKADNSISGNQGILVKITNIVAFIGGAAAIIMIIVAGIRYITSGSDISTGSRTDTDVESAKHTIYNAVIGLIVIVLARTIIVFVLNKI
jgi:hypothetical protein